MPILSLSEECEARFSQHLHPGALRDQVYFPEHAEERLEDL